jgi:hypothetical protein
MEDGRSAQVERLIGYAVRAGAFRAAARDYIDARATFEAAAGVNSAKVAALAYQIATTGPCRVSSDRMGR